MANSGSLGCVKYVETFIADNISTSSADGIAWVNSSDGGDTAFARAVAAARGLHCAGALAATANNLIEFNHDQTFIYGQNGYAMFEILFMLDNVANIAFNVGLNDDSLEASNTLPIELSGTTWTTNASTYVGLVFDTDATNDEVHCMWVNADADASTAIADLRMSGAAPVANKWMMARVSIQDRGSGNGVQATLSFNVDGKTFQKEFNTTVARGTALVPYFGVEQRATPTATNVYLKLPIIEQTIQD